MTAILPPNHPFSSRIYLARKNCPGSYKGSQNLGLSPHTQEISVSVHKSSDQVLGNHQTWQMNSIGQPRCPQKAPKRASKKGPNLDIRQLERLLTCIVWQLCARSQIGLHVSLSLFCKPSCARDTTSNNPYVFFHHQWCISSHSSTFSFNIRDQPFIFRIVFSRMSTAWSRPQYGLDYYLLSARTPEENIPPTLPIYKPLGDMCL